MKKYKIGLLINLLKKFDSLGPAAVFEGFQMIGKLLLDEANMVLIFCLDIGIN